MRSRAFHMNAGDAAAEHVETVRVLVCVHVVCVCVCVREECIDICIV